jgi:hypothetical protein
MPVRDPRSSRAWARAVALATALAAPLALLLHSGCDNPGCVYSGDCFGGGGGGGLGSNPANVPPDHAWLLPTQPQVTGFAPSGTENATTTPIVLRFSESMAPQSVIGMFELKDPEAGFGTSLTVPLLPPALVGDGRMLVLLPATPLQAGKTYELRLKQDAKVYDLTGTPLVFEDDGLFGSFGIADEDPEAPRVVANWPPDGAEDQSRTGEIAVVFDRRIDEESVTLESFAVTVGGTTPAQHPEAQPASFAAANGVPIPDTRAWVWRSAEDGVAVPLGPGSAVQLSLSPEGHDIVAEGEEGGVLPSTLLDFDLASFSAPLSAEIVSLPPDAIGIANLDDTRPLELAVEIEDALPSDMLGVFVFGTSLGTEPQLIALFRDVSLSAAGYDPTTGIATLGEDVLDLASSTSPVEARFADGALSFALRLERDGTSSPVRVLDLDPVEDGKQSPLLDTTRPVLDELWPAGSGIGLTRSDLSDLVVTGRASEPIRAAEVSTALGDNGILTPVCAWDAPESADDTGLFAAAPVVLGVLEPGDMPVDFDLLVYDRAFNPATAPSSGSLRQIGAVGPGAALPGAPTVSVEVFDSALLGALSGARVFTHRLDGPTPVLEDSAVTDANGRATLLTAASGATLVTVDADGYDLFTIQDLPVSRLGVPLQRSNTVSAVHQGRLTTVQALTDLTKWSHDARLVGIPGGLVPIQSCSSNPLTQAFECLFGPAPLAVGRLGAASVAVLDPPPNEFGYSAASFLKGWAARFPAPELTSGVPSALSFELSGSLEAGSQEERALDGPALDLDASASVDLDLAQLADEPVVTLEARLRSLPGALLAGNGTTFPLGGTPVDTWRVRCAFPGVVDFTDDKYPEDELGALVAGGQIDPDLFLRLELIDLQGRSSMRRVRFSALSPGVPVSSVDAPLLTAPAVGSVTPGPSYAVTFEEELDGSLAASALHHVTLSASDGRRWHLWVPIVSAGSTASVSAWAPPIAAAGGEPLASGPVTAVVESLTWPSFDPRLFLWSDVEREHDVRVRSAPVAFTQP